MVERNFLPPWSKTRRTNRGLALHHMIKTPTGDAPLFLDESWFCMVIMSVCVFYPIKVCRRIDRVWEWMSTCPVCKSLDFWNLCSISFWHFLCVHEKELSTFRCECEQLLLCLNFDNAVSVIRPAWGLLLTREMCSLLGGGGIWFTIFSADEYRGSWPRLSQLFIQHCWMQPMRTPCKEVWYVPVCP